jgi:hypothetical protein
MAYPDIKTGGVEEIADGFQRIGFGGTTQVKGIKTYDLPSGYKYDVDETLGASGEIPQRVETPIESYRKAVKGGLDNSLLRRAQSILDSFNCDDVMDATINMESLRGFILQLWESATNSSQFHQDILATLESAILSIESLNKNQLSAFREGIKDLGNEVLTQDHVDIIRREFIAKGFSPLALLSQIEGGNGSD